MYNRLLTAEIVPIEALSWGMIGPAIVAIIVFGVLVLFRGPIGKLLEQADDVEVRWRWLGLFLRLQRRRQKPP